MNNNLIIFIVILCATVILLFTGGGITGNFSLSVEDLDELFADTDEVIIIQGENCNNDDDCRHLEGSVCRRLLDTEPEKFCERPGRSGEICLRPNDCVTDVCLNKICIGSCLSNSDCFNGKRCKLRSNSFVGDCR